MKQGEKMTDNKKQILLVEDNPAHARLVMLCLEEFCGKASVKHVKDGEEALECLGIKKGNAGERPDLIFLDLRIPKIDGIEVLKNIKTCTNTSDIPVIILTTSEASHDMEQSYCNKANSYLVKPFDFEIMRKMLLDACSYWMRWDMHFNGGEA
jgi:two-component system response regulator